MKFFPIYIGKEKQTISVVHDILSVRARQLSNEIIGKQTSSVHFEQASAVQISRHTNPTVWIRAGNLKRTSTSTHSSDIICQNGQKDDNESFTSKASSIDFSTSICLSKSVPLV